jgi:hypothetical protein
MNSAIELHDSEVQSVEIADGVVRVFFSSAYVHCSTGKPGVDAGEGFSQSVEVVFSNAKCSGESAGFAGTVADGSVHVDAACIGLLPLPCLIKGNISANFVLASGAELSITAGSLQCVPTGGRTFIEAYEA